MSAAAILFVCALFFERAADAQEKAVPRSRADLTLSYASIVKQVAPAVVNVYVRSQVRRQRSPFLDDPFFQRFFGGGGDDFGGPSQRLQNSLGSGVIVSADGLVVTNNHVVQSEGGAETAIKVALSDAREFEASIILRDERTDLAVLRIEGGEKDFPHIPFADSDALEVGDIVLAIGNPFGVGQTVTSGIVSALARTRVGVSDYQFFIQTDAAINPGNSGGPLVDMNGRVVGINTAIFSRSGGSQGIGFAIPSNMVHVVVNSALRGGKVERPWLGAELEPVTSDIAKALGLDRPAGALVDTVVADGPAAKAGLRPRDVILSVDGRDAADAQAVFYRLATKGVGSEAELAVSRDGQPMKLKLALIAAPETTPRKLTLVDGVNPFAGATVANLSPAVAEEMSIEQITGVVVVETKAYSTARRVGLRPGDIIVNLNGKPIVSVRDLVDALKRTSRGWDVTIRRNGEDIRTVLRG
ncbi:MULTISPECIES: DegQ family serine endoprotease [Rhodomicrobium]|uniref:DegQ family serine endoprotease n=1 Tax=Rhodomicrobium TaxID=1068 RepID=UPI001FD88CDD|nr:MULTISPECIES: DegQ family serine endoprotease [Rhodomicrobium]